MGLAGPGIVHDDAGVGEVPHVAGQTFGPADLLIAPSRGASNPWRSGAEEAVIDRLAQAFVRDGHHGDAGDAGPVQRP